MSNYPQQPANQGYPMQPVGQGPGYQQYPQSAPPRKRLILGPLLMILGALLAQVSLWLSWNPGAGSVSDSGPGLTFSSETMNGWKQALVNMEMGRVYGTLMIVAFSVVALACILVVIAAFRAMAGAHGGNGALAITGALLGLLGTVGVIGGYLVLGALSESTYGMWLYAGSFVPVLIGAIGVATKKF